MHKLTLIFVLSLYSSLSYCQHDILIFKKRNKEIHRYWEGTTLSFQLRHGEWQKGEITSIRNDSFYIRPMVVRYHLMGADTFHYNIRGFALTDIYAMPNSGILIDYKDGRYQIAKWAGHVHFYWIKSGWLFRTGAAGYAGLHVANGLIKNDLSIKTSKTPLLIAAGVFLGGVLLHKHYKPYLRIGKKYRLSILRLSK